MDAPNDIPIILMGPAKGRKPILAFASLIIMGVNLMEAGLTNAKVIAEWIAAGHNASQRTFQNYAAAIRAALPSKRNEPPAFGGVPKPRTPLENNICDFVRRLKEWQLNGPYVIPTTPATSPSVASADSVPRSSSESKSKIRHKNKKQCPPSRSTPSANYTRNHDGARSAPREYPMYPAVDEDGWRLYDSSFGDHVQLLVPSQPGPSQPGPSQPGPSQPGARERPHWVESTDSFPYETLSDLSAPIKMEGVSGTSASHHTRPVPRLWVDTSFLYPTVTPDQAQGERLSNHSPCSTTATQQDPSYNLGDSSMQGQRYSQRSSPIACEGRSSVAHGRTNQDLWDNSYAADHPTSFPAMSGPTAQTENHHLAAPWPSPSLGIYDQENWTLDELCLAYLEAAQGSNLLSTTSSHSASSLAGSQPNSFDYLAHSSPLGRSANVSEPSPTVASPVSMASAAFSTEFEDLPMFELDPSDVNSNEGIHNSRLEQADPSTSQYPLSSAREPHPDVLDTDGSIFNDPAFLFASPRSVMESFLVDDVELDSAAWHVKHRFGFEHSNAASMQAEADVEAHHTRLNFLKRKDRSRSMSETESLITQLRASQDSWKDDHPKSALSGSHN